MLHCGLMPILQLASDWRESFTPAGHPLRGDHRPDRPHAEPAGPHRPTACPPSASRIKDVESKYYLALRLSVYRDLGATIAANPSTILAIARLGDREKATLIRDIADGTIDPKWDDPRRGPRRRPDPDPLEAEGGRPGGSKRSSSGPAGSCPRTTGPNLQFLANWTGGTMGAYLRGYPEYFGDRPVRDVGLIASEGRFTIPIDDGTPAGVLDIAPPLLRVHPRGPGRPRATPRPSRPPT